MPIDLEKIGKFLKEKRELKGLTLVDVSNSLCIRKSLINAMELGSWKLLPHEVYVRGYLKEYAHLR
jgi:cytoskeleton protein RodZ